MTRMSATISSANLTFDERLYRMYDKIEEAENNLMDARAKKQAIEADKITGDNIYKVLICFEKLYNVMNPLERKS